jgi:antitoxin ParD1/3/4
MPRKSRPITVTPGDLQEHVEARVKSGAYASASEVMRAAMRVLDREEAALDDWLRQRVDEALADPRPTAPARDVLEHLHRHHARQVKAVRPKTARNEKI